MVREWVWEAGARWGLGDSLWLCQPNPALETDLRNSGMPVFWQDNVRAFWRLRAASLRPISAYDPQKVMDEYSYTSVSFSGYCTVHYHKTQQITLRDFTIKSAYWCLVMQVHARGPSTKGTREVGSLPVRGGMAPCVVRD